MLSLVISALSLTSSPAGRQVSELPCDSWCNEYTHESAECAGCPATDTVKDGDHCSSWCNEWTCGSFFTHCQGCHACNPLEGKSLFSYQVESKCQCLGVDVTPYAAGGAYEGMTLGGTYGSSCMAWDNMEGTPWYDPYCINKDTCSSADNWCQLNWCYVDKDCPTATKTDVFVGQSLYFSYDACLVPDCYSSTPPLPNPAGSCPFGCD